MMSRLLTISKAEREKAPVLIVGEARSGSTLLQRTLELHPVFRPKQVAHHEAKIFSFTNRSHNLRIEKWTGPFDYMLCDTRVFRQFLHSIIPITRMHRIISCQLTAGAALKFPVFYLLGLNEYVVRSFFHFARLARKCERIAEKSPYNIYYLRQIKLCYPNSKLLYIHRHPVDVYSSYRRVTRELGRDSWTDISPAKFCTQYRDRTSIALRWRRRDDFRLVRYESFVQETEREWQGICSFLGIPLMYEPITIQHNPDRHDSYETYIKGPIVAKTKKYQDYLTRAEADCIENSLADLLAVLNYARYT